MLTLLIVCAVIGMVSGGIIGWKNMKTEKTLQEHAIGGNWGNLTADVMRGIFVGLIIGLIICAFNLAAGRF